MEIKAQIPKTETVYLIPGQGADYRLYEKLSLPGYDTVALHYIIPEKKETLPEYARRMAEQIDTTQPFSIVGVSFGGMIAVEMSEFLDPRKVILVSSAKCRKEFPVRYHFLNAVPLYKMFPGKAYKKMANFARPIFEKDSRGVPVFKNMIDDKHPHFMKRSIHCIMSWPRKEYPQDVYHIHGTKDHTLPFRKIKDPIIVENGSHMMIYLKAEEISEIFLVILHD